MRGVFLAPATPKHAETLCSWINEHALKRGFRKVYGGKKVSLDILNVFTSPLDYPVQVECLDTLGGKNARIEDAWDYVLSVFRDQRQTQAIFILSSISDMKDVVARLGRIDSASLHCDGDSVICVDFDEHQRVENQFMCL